MSSHYSGGAGSSYGGAANSGSYYSRSREAERGRDRDRGREWRRSERDRSRGRSREREKERAKSPAREARYSEYGGGRDRERRQERYGGKRFGGKQGGRFADRPSPPSTSSTGIPEVEPSSLIREKDLNAARLLGYAGNPNQYGPSYHYSSHGHYGLPTEPKTEHKSKAKDPKSNPLFKAAVDTLVMNIKTKGDYDQIRKECFSDIDTKAAYLNLHSRIRATVDKYLNQQTYKKDMDKVKVREGMRKKILDTPYFERGIESVVNQILTPKIASLIRPKIEEEVYKYLNIKKGGGAPDTVPSAGPVRQETEVEFKNVISTKEFSFHDITTAVKVKQPTTTPPSRPVPTTPRSESEKDSEDERQAKVSDDDSDSESSEGIATPLYSPAGKTPMADDDDDDEEYDRQFAIAGDKDNEESKGSLQIDEFAEPNKSAEVESKVESEESEPEARTPTPTLPEGSISPIVPRKESPTHHFSDEAAFVPAASAYIVKDHLAQLTLSQIHSPPPPPPSAKIDEHNLQVPPHQYIPLPLHQYTVPLPPQSPTVENVPPLPPSSPQKSLFPHPPPPACDDTACSSPPPPESQQSEGLPFSTSNQQPSDAEEQNDSGEPLPPGEEPEGYFIQMRQKMEEDKKNMQERPKSPIPLQSDINPNVHEEEIADEEEEMEEDSDEESPMFEKVGEVSPPRPLELHNSDLAHELTKELLSQVQVVSTADAELLSELTGSTHPNNSEHSEDNSKQIPPEITPEDLPDADSDAPSETESDKYCKFLEPIPDYELKMNYYRRFRDAT